MAVRHLRPARQALRSLSRPTTLTATASCCCRQAQQKLVQPRFYSSKEDGSSSSEAPPRQSERLPFKEPVDPQPTGELQVGELPGGQFRIAPLRRVGEDAVTKRARLLYQSRKRGILECDLLLSTYAAANLATMTPAELDEFDLFMDENDWDIYYWATQEEDPIKREEDEAAAAAAAAADRPGPSRPAHEWAQTVGTFKPAYRPVPERWRDSQTLARLREHVHQRSAQGAAMGKAERESRESSKGMAFMPPVPDFNARNE